MISLADLEPIRGVIGMSESDSLEFKPRARGLIIGELPWLARIADKARARAAGRLGAYVYP